LSQEVSQTNKRYLRPKGETMTTELTATDTEAYEDSNEFELEEEA
jgi:hypothetical protein